MKLQEIINWSPKEQEPTRQRKLAGLLIGFLVLMLILTMISRAADALTVAQVKTEQPKSGAIEHTVKSQGTLSANKETAVLTAEGLLVESVEVYPGAAVKVGDPLFTIGISNVEEQLKDKKMDLQKQQTALQVKQLELQGKETSQQLESEKKEKELQRAYEDIDYDLEKADKAVQDKERAIKDVEKKIDDFWEDRGRAHRESIDLDNATASEIEAWENQDPNILSDGEEDQLDSLKKELREAKLALEDAKQDRERAKLSAERKIEDAQPEESVPDGSKESAAMDMQTIALEIQKLAADIDKLQSILAGGATITSPVDGVITEISVKTGGKTPPDAAAIIALTSEGLRFKTTLSEDDAKYAARGDKVEVVLGGKSKGIETTIASMTPSTDKSGGMDLIAMMSEGEIGQSAELNISKRSESFQTRIPINALRGSSNDQYVLIIDEADTVLGKQKIARKVAVTVKDQNDMYAAVEGALSSYDKVIVSSSKSIGDGDRVRTEG